MSATTTSPAWKRPGRDLEADLAPVHRHRHVGPDGRTLDLAGVGDHARGEVDGDDRHAGSVHLLDRAAASGLRLAAEAGTEQRVDQDVALDALLGRPPGRAQHLERDPAVAAVRAAAADGAERACVRVPTHRLLGDGAPGPLHQRRNVVTGLGGLHLLRRVERLEHPHPRRS